MQHDFLFENGRIYLNDQADHMIAEICYQPVAGKAIWQVTHTFVNPDYRGEGLAEELLDALADLARVQAVQLEPVCKYAKLAFHRKSKYADVALPSD